MVARDCPWIGEVLAATIKRHRIGTRQIRQALAAYGEIPLRLIEVDLESSLQMVVEHRLYAYDAYVIACARRQRCGLLALDQGLLQAAQPTGSKPASSPPFAIVHGAA